MRGLTISELEKASGVPRSTIYFYVREGLLPVAQKAAASRAVYAESHLDLLKDIAALKDVGLPLQSIKERLAAQVASAGALDVDLVAEQAERVRQSILAAAARLFAQRGYKRTRVADIIKEAGVTPPVFYSYFASKRDLFFEAFQVVVGWMRDLLKSRLPEQNDAVTRELARVHGYLGIQTLSPDLLALVRSEALQEDIDMRQLVARTYTENMRDTAEDLADLREQRNVSLPAPDELMAFGLRGSVENIVMRASWDGRYSNEDVLWTALCIFLAVEGVYTGRLDLADRLAEHKETIARLAVPPTVVPPAAVPPEARPQEAAEQ